MTEVVSLWALTGADRTFSSPLWALCGLTCIQTIITTVFSLFDDVIRPAAVL